MTVISIISAVRNSESAVGDCVRCVVDQAGVDVEHLVIDGASTDGTLAVVESHPHPRRVVVSEPDRGTYDALNKGIRLASGDVVGILHADDVFAHDRVLARVAGVFADGAVDACYEDLVYVAGWGMRDVGCGMQGAEWRMGNGYEGTGAAARLTAASSGGGGCLRIRRFL